MEFAEKLRRLMSKQRYSQNRLGLVVGVSQNLVGKWSRGESLPDIREAHALAEALGVDIGYLADDAQDEPRVGLTPAEAAAVKMVRSLELDEPEVLRLLAAGRRPWDGRIPAEAATHLGHRIIPSVVQTYGPADAEAPAPPPASADRPVRRKAR